MKLTEGFDCPSLKTVWVRDSSKAPTIQMCGRVLRLHDELPVKYVVQSQQTTWPFTKTATPEQSWVFQENGWKSLKVNEKIADIHRSAMRAVAGLNIQLPNYVAQRMSKKSRLNSADGSTYRGPRS
jgi:hypothetical protein